MKKCTKIKILTTNHYQCFQCIIYIIISLSHASEVRQDYLSSIVTGVKNKIKNVQMIPVRSSYYIWAHFVFPKESEEINVSV